MAWATRSPWSPARGAGPRSRSGRATPLRARCTGPASAGRGALTGRGAWPGCSSSRASPTRARPHRDAERHRGRVGQPVPQLRRGPPPGPARPRPSRWSSRRSATTAPCSQRFAGRWATVQAQQAAVAGSMGSKVRMIETRGLARKDDLHYTTASYITIGQRFANAYWEHTVGPHPARFRLATLSQFWERVFRWWGPPLPGEPRANEFAATKARSPPSRTGGLRPRAPRSGRRDLRRSPLPPCGGGVGGGGYAARTGPPGTRHPLSQHWERGPGGEGPPLPGTLRRRIAGRSPECGNVRNGVGRGGARDA